MAKAPTRTIFIQPIPINTAPWTDVDGVALSSLATELWNAFLYSVGPEKKLLTMNRPGLFSPPFCDLTATFTGLEGSPVDGLFWWASKSVLLATCAGRVFSIDSAGTATELTGIGVSLTQGRTIFAQAGIGGSVVFMASGGALIYTDGTALYNPVGLGLFVGPADISNQPITCTHVAAFDTYVIANVTGTPWFVWSDPDSYSASVVTNGGSTQYYCYLAHIAAADNEPGTGTNWQLYWKTPVPVTVPAAQVTAWTSGNSYYAGWQGISIAKIGAKGDTLKALDVRSDMIHLFGEFSIEHWYNDGSSPFSKYEGATSETGTMVPYSLCFDGNRHWFITESRDLVKMENYAPVVVNTPFGNILQNMAYITDGFTIPVKCDGRNFLVVTFPTSNVTLAYDVDLDVWQGQWGTWNQNTISFDRWLVNCYAKCPDWGLDLAGDRRTGKIYRISRNFNSDAELLLRVVRQTGNMDMGIPEAFTKRLNKVRLTLRRGVGLPDPTVTPTFTLRTRVDGDQVWGNQVAGDMGKAGETLSTIEFRQLGCFRTIQFEFVLTDAVPLEIVGATAELDVRMR